MQPYIGGPRADLSLEVVKASLASPSPRIRHGVDVLDRSLVETGETLPVDLDGGGKVDWSYRPSDSALGATAVTGVRRSATLSVAGDVSDELLVARLFRLWTEMQAPTTGDWVRWHLGVFLATLPGKSWDGQVIRRTLNLLPREHLWASQSADDWVTVDAADVVLDVVRADLDAVFAITEDAFPVPPGDTTPGEDMVFPAGTPYLDKWTRLLNAVGLDQPVTREDGLPTSVALADLAARAAEVTYAPQGTVEEAGRIKRDGSVDPVDPTLPNTVRYVARRGPSLPEEGNGQKTYYNQSTGPGSLDARGFPVFASVDADASTQAELESFGEADSQRLFAGGGKRFVGTVGFNPRHSDRDVVHLTRDALGLDDDFCVTSWSLPLRRIDGEGAVAMPFTAEARVAVT